MPRSGALFFFFEGGENAWGFSSKDRGSSRVLYSSKPLREIPVRSFPADLDEELRFKGVELGLQPVERTVPGFQDQVLEGLEMAPEESEAYFNFVGSRQEDRIHRMGGYPDCVQGDPKLEAQLVSHGLYCGDQTGYKIGKKRGLWPGAKDWELLLQVDSDDRAGMMWGDVGRIYFLIQKERLAERQFGKTWLVFQCS